MNKVIVHGRWTAEQAGDGAWVLSKGGAMLTAIRDIDDVGNLIQLAAAIGREIVGLETESQP